MQAKTSVSCRKFPPLLALAIASVTWPSFTAASSVERPSRLLYVGNSFYYYNNSLHGHVNRLLADALPKGEREALQSYSVTISGGHLKWHNIGAYLDAGIGDSSFNENNEVVVAAESKRFDSVMMMDCSRCPYDEATRTIFHREVKRQGETIRERGVTPLLFMTWAYSDKPDMIDTLAREYVRAGNDNNMRVVPAGLAFDRALRERADLRLHTADRRHPSLAGTYLAACAVLASVYRLDPRENRYTAGLPAADAAFLQQVAWATVSDFEAMRASAPQKPE